MQTFFFTSLFLILFAGNLSAQKNYFTQLPGMIESYLAKEGTGMQFWNIHITDGMVTITSEKKVIFYNGINMQAFRTEEERETFIRGIGHEGNIIIKLRFEEAWGKSKYESVKAQNMEYENQIGKLAEINRINELSHKYDSYIAATKAEEKRLKAYEAGRDSLQKLIVPLPDYEAEGGTFFISDNLEPSMQPFPAEAWGEAMLLRKALLSTADLVYEAEE